MRTPSPLSSRQRERKARRSTRVRATGVFISKRTDCDSENAETDSSLDFARDCGCLTITGHRELTVLKAEDGKLPGSMLLHPQKWLLSHT
jgi:hypothetical protein